MQQNDVMQQTKKKFIKKIYNFLIICLKSLNNIFLCIICNIKKLTCCPITVLLNSSDCIEGGDALGL